MTHDFRIEVRTDPRLLASLRELVRSWIAPFGLGEETEHGVVLAIDEACSNAMRHAYQGQWDRHATLLLRSTEDYLEFELSDEGTPCQPERVARRELERPDPETVTPGGLGVQLIYQVFDEVQFHPGSPCGNRVIMRINRSR